MKKQEREEKRNFISQLAMISKHIAASSVYDLQIVFKM